MKQRVIPGITKGAKIRPPLTSSEFRDEMEKFIGCLNTSSTLIAALRIALRIYEERYLRPQPETPIPTPTEQQLADPTQVRCLGCGGVFTTNNPTLRYCEFCLDDALDSGHLPPVPELPPMSIRCDRCGTTYTSPPRNAFRCQCGDILNGGYLPPVPELPPVLDCGDCRHCLRIHRDHAPYHAVECEIRGFVSNIRCSSYVRG